MKLWNRFCAWLDPEAQIRKLTEDLRKAREKGIPVDDLEAELARLQGDLTRIRHG